MKSLLFRRKTIIAIFIGTGKQYGDGNEFVGYKLIMYKIPKQGAV